MIATPPPSKPDPRNCPECQHRHYGVNACHHSTARDNLCLCKSEKGGAMSKENGKDPDVEVIQGNVTTRSTIIGLRVKSASVKEASDGGAVSVATVIGNTRINDKIVGEAVNLMTAGNRRVLQGRCTEVAVKVGKEEGKKIYQAKVVGARDLDDLVGLQVTIAQAQGELPLAEEASPDQAIDEIRKLKPKGHELAVNPPKKRRARGREAAAGD